MALPFVASQKHPKVVTVKMEEIDSGWQAFFLLRSDSHHDNTQCDSQLEKRHLEQAKERNAGILDFGDLFDLMGGREDKRRAKEHLPKDIRASAAPYADAVLDYCASFYEPYAANWILLGQGNHETAFFRKNETDLSVRLAERLQRQGGCPLVGSYEGWVRFMFQWNHTKRTSYNLWYHHGYGGASPATKGVTQNHRQMAFLGNADFVVGGHVHNQYWITDVKQTLDHQGRAIEKRVECLRCPGYKNESDTGNGWAVERGHPPRPRGAWWLRFYLEFDAIQYEITQAK